MAEVGETWVSVMPSAKGFGKDLDKQIGTEVDSSGFGSSLTSAFGKVGKAAAVGLGAAAIGAAALGTTVVKSFGDLEQNLGGAEAVFGEFANTIKTEGEAAYKALGMSQSDYLGTANKMGALFQGSGLSQQDSLDMTTKAMQRAADMASVMGIDTATAMESITGAAKGNFEMMDNLGVAMNATTIEAYALEKGVNFDWETASQAEKTEMAMQMFFDRTSQYAGNFEKEATQTISGAFGLLSASWTSLVAGLGNSDADISALTTNLIDAFGAVVENVGPVLQTLADNIPTVLTQLVGQLGTIVEPMLEVGASLIEGLLAGLIDAAPDIVEAAVPIIMSLIESLLAQLPAIMRAAIQIIIALVEGITASLPTLIPAMYEAVRWMLQALLDNLPMILQAGLELLTALGDGLIAALPALMDVLPEIILQIAEFLIAAVPTILDAGVQLLMALIDAIPLILPPLLEVLPNVITALIGYLVEAIPQLIDGAVSLLMALIDAIPLIIPPLVAALPEIITALVTGVTEAIPALLEGAITLLTALIDAIPLIIPPLIEAIPDIITALIGAIIDAVPDLLQAGVDLIMGFIEGIKSMAGRIVDAIKSTITDVLPGFVKDALGIHSPSRVFAELGRFTGLGFEEGITSSLQDAGEAAKATLMSQMGDLANQAGGSLSGLQVTADLIESQRDERVNPLTRGPSASGVLGRGEAGALVNIESATIMGTPQELASEIDWKLKGKL